MDLAPRQAGRVPALVLGSGFTALGVLRNLATSGVPVYHVSEGPDLVRWSRWCHPAPPSSGPRPTPDALAAYLLGSPLDRAVLIPCSDQWALATVGLPAPLAQRFPSSAPPAGSLRTLTDKAAFAHYCERSGIPHPRTLVLEDAHALLSLPHDAFRDAFLKPCDSQRFMARYGVKAVRVRNRREAHRLASEFTTAGFRLLLQRYVRGPVTNHYFVDGFVDANGAVPAVFVRRRLRMYPPDFGNSSYMMSVPPEEATPAVEKVRRVLADLSFRGVFSAEFKRDADDGVFRILEVNGRPWWFIRFAARCGVNVSRMAYDDALKRPVAPVAEYEVGRRCVNAYYDYFACRGNRPDEEVSLRKWVGSVLRSHQTAFEWMDPMPACLETTAILGRAVGRRLAQALLRRGD